jgi:hypothetical protein
MGEGRLRTRRLAAERAGFIPTQTTWGWEEDGVLQMKNESNGEVFFSQVVRYGHTGALFLVLKFSLYKNKFRLLLVAS